VHRLATILLASVCVAISGWIAAQTPSPSNEPNAQPESEDSDGERNSDGKPGRPPRDEPMKTQEMPGDVLLLESGSRMTGVQVLRATPQFYEVEVVNGVKLEIPRRRVKEVIYDDVDPSRDRLKQELFPEEQEVTIASGERVTSALRDKLMAPVSSVPLSYKNRDFAEALDEITAAQGLNLRVHPSIRELPPSDRTWTVEIPADRTLLAYLREDLVGAFDFLEVIFEADRIVVLTKEAAVKRAENMKNRQQEEVNPAPQPPSDPALVPPAAPPPSE
jgi:hypothetical protein